MPIRNWIFDLDNTLYPVSSNLFAQVDQRMGRFIADLLGYDLENARKVQKDYFYRYGTTLSGLMHHHSVDPHAFLDFVHDIDMAVIRPDPALVRAIAALPGRKLIFTNGDRPYAEKLLARLGMDGLFDAVHDIHAVNYKPKPQDAAYDSLIAATGIDPTRSLFVEDMARNLVPAKRRGMTTVWLNTGSEWGAHDADAEHVDFEIDDLARWLEGVPTMGDLVPLQGETG